MPDPAMYAGACYVLLAILFFGSFAVPIKARSVVQAGVHPIVYQAYKSAACFACSLLILLVMDVRFSWWGIAGAAMWVRLHTASLRRSVSLLGAVQTSTCRGTMLQQNLRAHPVFRPTLQHGHGSPSRVAPDAPRAWLVAWRDARPYLFYASGSNATRTVGAKLVTSHDPRVLPKLPNLNCQQVRQGCKRQDISKPFACSIPTVSLPHHPRQPGCCRKRGKPQSPPLHPPATRCLIAVWPLWRLRISLCTLPDASATSRLWHRRAYAHA
jgi:hypothetical protein